MDDKALARNTDPETSHAAAAGVGVQHMQICVLAALARAPFGMTVSEIAEKANYPRDSISPRMRPMLECQIVKRDGTKRKPYLANPRPGKTPMQLVWEITENGRDVLKKWYAQKA